jgi:exopolysaccharide biosynthesis polyprenyl glycosylphosphotransferase
MATSEFLQKLSASISSPPLREAILSGNTRRGSRGKTGLWMFLDGVTILGAVVLVTLNQLHTGLLAGAREFWNGTLIQGCSMGMLLAFLGGFTLTLIVISQGLSLYEPLRLHSFLREQGRSLQACFTTGLLLTGALYLVHANDIPRSIVLTTVVLVTVLLGLRRFAYRMLLYRRFERGVDTRNVLIVGTGPEAHALRRHLDSIRHLGYTFKGFVDTPGDASDFSVPACDVVGSLDKLFQFARQHFVDEIFFTTPCERAIISDVLTKARVHGVDLRVVPDLYDGLAWNSPIEYIGQFPTFPLHCGQVPELGLFLKRAFDSAFSFAVLLALSPILLVIAIAIKFDSPGPVFYASERIGKKGRAFRCIKFRTMVRDADKRRAEILHMNERDGVLFKVSNDPRITPLGRILRKYSLDELPQFFNVLYGDMSIVGPRPPLASEVKKYDLGHLRRLDVTPGITGLWQVQGRQDPSFASYVSLDVAYIDNWSLWLDFKIVLRTIGVVLAGTGS